MLTEREYLLTCLAEECNEVAQRVSKALRFGENEIYEDHPDGIKATNFQRIQQELYELISVAQMVGLDTDITEDNFHKKLNRLGKYMKYSRELGTLEGERND